MDLIEQYREEINKDLLINDFNIKEIQLKLPARKHFWVARLIDAKINLNKLIKRKKLLKETIISRIISEAPVRITQQTAEISAESTDDLQNIANSIKEHEFL